MSSSSKFSSAFTYTLEISERELQEKVAMIMPLTKKSLFFSVIIYEPEIQLHSLNNEIGFFAHVDVVVPGGLKGSGRGMIKGKVVYDSADGAFYLNQPNIEGLEIDRIPRKVIPSITKTAQIILSKSLSKYPVYKLKDDDVKHQLAKSTLKSISIENECLLVTLGL